MALINCPECGRINVSSSAVACPDCGFPIKDHFLTQEKDSYTDELTAIIETVDNDDILAKKEIEPLTIKCKNCSTLYSDDISQCPTCGNWLDVSDYFDITACIENDNSDNFEIQDTIKSEIIFSGFPQENITQTRQSDSNKNITQVKTSSKEPITNRKGFWAFVVVIILLGFIFLGSGSNDKDDRTCAWCNGTGYNGNGAQSVEEYVFKKTPCKHCNGKGTY